MKLSAYARKVGVSYKTALKWYHAGKIKGQQMATGAILIDEDKPINLEVSVVYARVSSSENGDHLASQAERLVGYCRAKG